MSAQATIPYVDFVSFHHWGSAEAMRSYVALLRDLTDKPILLEEFGYSTYQVNQAQQTTALREVIEATLYDELAGWLGGMDQYKSGRGSDSAHWLSMWSGGSPIFSLE